MSSTTSQKRIRNYFNQNTEIEKKMLFTDFWFPVMLFIIMLFVANAFVPVAKYDAASKTWSSYSVAMDNIDMIAYVVLVALLAFAGLWKIGVRLYRARSDFSSANGVGQKGKKLVGISSILALISCLLYLGAIVSLPYVLEGYRTDLLFDGSTITNANANTWILNVMLSPAYAALISIIYTSSLAIYFEVKKRKDGVQWDAV